MVLQLGGLIVLDSVDDLLWPVREIEWNLLSASLLSLLLGELLLELILSRLKLSSSDWWSDVWLGGVLSLLEFGVSESFFFLLLFVFLHRFRHLRVLDGHLGHLVDALISLKLITLFLLLHDQN